MGENWYKMTPYINVNLNVDITEEAFISIDDIYEGLSHQDKMDVFWWILEDVFDNVKNQLQERFEEEKDD